MQGVTGILDFTRVIGQRMGSFSHGSTQNDLLHHSEAAIDAILTYGSNKVRKTNSTCVNISSVRGIFEFTRARGQNMSSSDTDRF